MILQTSHLHFSVSNLQKQKLYFFCEMLYYLDFHDCIILDFCIVMSPSPGTVKEKSDST